MTHPIKLQAPLFAAFLKGARNIRIAKPWPDEKPEARIIRFMKDGEEWAAAFDTKAQLACVMTLDELKETSGKVACLSL